MAAESRVKFLRGIRRPAGPEREAIWVLQPGWPLRMRPSPKTSPLRARLGDRPRVESDACGSGRRQRQPKAPVRVAKLLRKDYVSC